GCSLSGIDSLIILQATVALVFFQEIVDKGLVDVVGIDVEHFQAKMQAEQADAAGVAPRLAPDRLNGFVGKERALTRVAAGGQQSVFDQRFGIVGGQRIERRPGGDAIVKVRHVAQVDVQLGAAEQDE